MLLNYSQFQLREGVRSSTGLLNPRLTLSEDISIPKESVIHYLDYKSDEQFPLRSINYLSGAQISKRVPITNVIELISNTDTTVLANRALAKQLMAWRMANSSHFKVVDLLTTPNLDTQVNSIFNYQTLKGLYKYRSTPAATISKYDNVYGTYWSTVGKAIKADTSSEHFVTIPVPSLIPSRSLLETILKYPPSVYARIVSDPDLNSVIQLYKFLNTETRSSSVMSPINDEDTLRITVELTHGGYSSFFKLSYLVSLSEESKLENKRKIKPETLQRMFLLMLLKIQKGVYDLQNTVETDAVKVTSTVVIDTDGEEEEDEEAFKDTPDTTSLSELSVSSKVADKLKPLVSKNDEEMPETAEDVASITTQLNGMEGETDDIFNNLISKIVTKDAETKPPKKVNSSTDTDDGVEDKDYVDEEQIIEEMASIEPDYSEENVNKLLSNKTTSEDLEEHLSQAKASGSASNVEVRAIRKTFEERKTLKSPYADKLIDEHKIITEEDTSLPKEDTLLKIDNNLVDDALKTEVLFNFDRLYLDKLMSKDVISCVTKIEEAGVIVKDYKVERNNSVLGSYEVHKLTLKPLKGKESTIYFRLPVINEEGEFKASGITYRMRKQRAPLVLVKLSPDKVSITSNYGKLFVSRTERKSYDPYAQFSDWVKSEYLGDSKTIVSIHPGNCFDNLTDKPNMLMAMSVNFKMFSTANYTFIFSSEQLLETIAKDTLTSIESSGKFFVIGYKNSDKTILVMDRDNQIFSNSDLSTPLGDLPTLAGMDSSKLPVQFAGMKVLGDTLALGPVLGYYLGIKGLLEVTGTKFEIVGPRKQPTLTKDTIVIKTEDCKLLVAADTPTKKLIFGGFLFYKETLKSVTLESLESKSVYLNIFEQRGSKLMHLRELDLLRQLFLDPITVDVLKSTNQPTDYLRVLLKACDMLDDFKHPDANDPDYCRIRGYDRVPGLMYRILSQSVRAAKMGMSKNKIELDPYAVWNAITQDTTVKIVEDTNPITDIKETEAVTFTGADGLNKSSTPEKLRRYHSNDIGLVSEATVDSSDVALNIYLTPYAKLENLRGLVSKEKTVRKDTIFSTSVLLTPMGEFDDPKRVN